jgi:DNA-binding beta-propeller fold protein YncE
MPMMVLCKFLQHNRIYYFFLFGLALSGFLSPLQADADGGAPDLVYVAGSPGGVGIIDVAQQKITGEFTVAGDPYTILLSPDGRELYVTQPATGRVIAMAAKTKQMICSATFPGHPALLALNSDGTVLYVAGRNETTIIALDPQTCELQHSFQTTEPIYWITAAGVSTANALQTQLWVAGMSTVSILDEQGQILDSIPIAGGPRFLCIPNALTAYVATRQGEVLAVDMVNHEVFASLLTKGTFGPMDYDAITGEIYVPDQQHNQVDVLSPVLAGSGLTPQEPTRVIHLSNSPQAIAITNDGQLGFIALSGGMVDMLDIPARRLIKAFSVGGSPHFIITGPYPPPGVPTPRLTSATPLNIDFLIPILAVVAGAILGSFWLILRQRSRRSPLP